MGKLQRIVRAAMGHEGVVDFGGRHDRAHRYRAVGDLLREIEDIGAHPKRLRTRIGAAAAQTGDHLVKNQQNVVGIAELAQPL